MRRRLLSAAHGSPRWRLAAASPAGRGARPPRPGAVRVRRPACPVVEGDFGSEPTVTVPRATRRPRLRHQDGPAQGTGARRHQGRPARRRLRRRDLGRPARSSTPRSTAADPGRVPDRHRPGDRRLGQGLVGQKVGSRVAAGRSRPRRRTARRATPTPASAPTDTLVFVVDLLGAHTTATRRRQARPPRHPTPAGLPDGHGTGKGQADHHDPGGQAAHQAHVAVVLAGHRATSSRPVDSLVVQYVGRQVGRRQDVRLVLGPRRAGRVPDRRRPGHQGLGHRAGRQARR